MYCPQCRVEYRQGFTQCADCGVPLAVGAPPPPEKAPVPVSPEELSMDDLVPVLGSSEPVQMALAKGLLEDAGIPFAVRPGEHAHVAPALPDASRGVLGCMFPWQSLDVARARVAEARELLAPLLNPVDGAEPESSEAAPE
jgi:hypothetical protein